MRLGLVVTECGPVPGQLVEDPLARGAGHGVAGIDDSSGLMGADARCRPGYELIEVGFAVSAYLETHTSATGSAVSDTFSAPDVAGQLQRLAFSCYQTSPDALLPCLGLA